MRESTVKLFTTNMSAMVGGQRSETRGIERKWLNELPASEPLDKYRAISTFSWKDLRSIFDDAQSLEMKYKIWKYLEDDPDFHPLRCYTPSIDEQQRRAGRHTRKLDWWKVLPKNFEQLKQSEMARLTMVWHTTTAQVHKASGIKLGMGVYIFGNVIKSLGTERHLPYYRAVWNHEMHGAIALTEIGHGSDTRLMQTTATYDPSTQEFVLHTPNFKAAKCWAGNLGHTCTVALVFAQLITLGENYGLNVFIVPIRDPKTYLPYPGVTVGDMGEKMGLNGLDNGFAIFDNYRISRTSLLNRVADVTPEGEYVTSLMEPQKIFGIVMGNLSTARVSICQESTDTMSSAMVIATRYAAVRTQFTSGLLGDGQGETPIIEYELHQWRLFPYLAAVCAFRIFIPEFLNIFYDSLDESLGNEKVPNTIQIVREIHAMISAAKPLISWSAKHAISECREACGGHGYLKAANLGDLSADHEPKVTYEGDNNVLGQQTSNWLLNQWAEVQSGSAVCSPLGTATFLQRGPMIITKTSRATVVNDVMSLDFVGETYEWLITWLVDQTQIKINEQVAKGLNNFAARSKAQVYRAASLSKAYGEMIIWKLCITRLEKLGWRAPDKHNLRIVIEKLLLLYLLTCLEKHLPTFYQGGYCSGPRLANLLRESILIICAQLKPEAVSIADALAPPDFVLNSVLGMSDGKVYERLEGALRGNPGAAERVNWWRELLPANRNDEPTPQQSKL